MNRMNLRVFFDGFQQSVALFELLERGGGPPSVGVFGGVFIQYRMIAARDGALNIYHFGCSLGAIKSLRPQSAHFSAAIDPIKIREAVKLFKSHFPHADNVRHAIAHAGERYSDPRELNLNVQKGSHEGHGFSIGAGGIFSHALYKRIYSVGNRGDVFSVEMSDASSQKLLAIIHLVDLAFSSQ